jgi:hypothetical protein
LFSSDFIMAPFLALHMTPLSLLFCTYAWHDTTLGVLYRLLLLLGILTTYSPPLPSCIFSQMSYYQ